MTLEKQVVSLELAKRLKELGVKQESLFVWSNAEWELTGELKQGSKWSIRERAVPEPKSSYSAFTVAELGEMLPATITHGDDDWKLQCHKHREWEVKYISYDKDGEGYVLGDYKEGSRGHGTEADARAKMLIYLLENNLITL